MKLLIEEYQYNIKDVAEILDGLYTLQNVDGNVSVHYVGYFFNPRIKDCVFILPKVLINEKGQVFGHYKPEDVIDLDSAEITDPERKFIYEFAVWIYRALVVYRNSNTDSKIVLQRQIESESSGKKKKANTWLDIILALIRFNRENRSFFTFVLKNLHSGFNKINWGKTISGTTAVVQDENVVYLNPVNKKRQVNFDEELIVIFFSILNYVSSTFGFTSELPFGFKLIVGGQFTRYMEGYGRRRLRQIKYKYYSDTAVRLWDLCYAFFDKAYQINMSVDQREYLLAKSFYIVFEQIIQSLIGDEDVPKGLQEQEDGKLIDHFYTYKALVSNREPDNDIYYIGDSKYYRIGSNPKGKAVYKQYTYARNVIQWNIDIFADDTKKKAESSRFHNIQLRDDVTEGYNVIPNFFISANIPSNDDGSANLIYDDITEPHNPQPPISRHFKNRLYDRDTLLLAHYDVNFLYVLKLYARNNAGAIESYKESVRRKFRKAIQEMLQEHYSFYAMQAHEGVDYKEYFETHFQAILGKTFTPFADKQIFSLALEAGDPKNDEILTTLRKDFYVAECKLGNEPEPIIAQYRASLGPTPLHSDHSGVIIFAYMHYDHNAVKFRESGKVAIPIVYNKDGMRLLENFASTGYIMFHKWNIGSQHLFRLTEKPKIVPKSEIHADYLNIRNISKPDEVPDEVEFLYLLLDFDMQNEFDSSSLDVTRRKLPPQDRSRYEALFATLDELTIPISN